MSHYMYSNKKIMKTSNDMIFFVCEVADSSTTDWTGRTHPKHWCVMSFDELTDSLLMKKESYDAFVANMCQNEIQKMQSFYDKCGYCKVATPLTDNYCGNTYRGSKKIKDMKSFFSAARAISANEFFEKYEVVLKLSIYGKNKEIFAEQEGRYINIRNEQELIDANTTISALRNKATTYGDIEVLFYVDVLSH